MINADIMIVDDNPANLHLLAEMLNKRGHRVRPVADGKTALAAARCELPDLILLDTNMPEMDGYAVCAELKADPLLAEIPVIFISANIEVSDKVRAFSAGGVDYVTKPFQFEEVEARVATHLKIRRMQSEIEALNRSLQVRVDVQGKEISASKVATILSHDIAAEFDTFAAQLRNPAQEASHV